MTGRWTHAHLRAAEAAWACWQVLLADDFDADDDGLLAAIEERSGVRHIDLYRARIDADRAAGVFRAFPDPGKDPPRPRPTPFDEDGQT